MTRFLFVLGLTLALALTPSFAQEAAGGSATPEAGAAASAPSTGEAAAAPTTDAATAEWTCAACKVAVKDGKCEKCGEMKYGCDHCKMASPAEGKCACGMDYTPLAK